SVADAKASLNAIIPIWIFLIVRVASRTWRRRLRIARPARRLSGCISSLSRARWANPLPCAALDRAARSLSKGLPEHGVALVGDSPARRHRRVALPVGLAPVGRIGIFPAHRGQLEDHGN